MEKENGQVQPQLYGTSYLFVRIALTGHHKNSDERTLSVFADKGNFFFTYLVCLGAGDIGPGQLL